MNTLKQQTAHLKQQILNAKISGLVIGKIYPHDNEDEMRVVAVKYKDEICILYFKPVNGKYYLVNSLSQLNEIDHASLFVELSRKTNSK